MPKHITLKKIQLTFLFSIAMTFLLAALTACTSPQPVAYKGIASSALLTANLQDDDGHIPFRYSRPVDWRRYNQMIVDPVVIYRALDNQLANISEDDKSVLANYMWRQFTEKLKPRFTIVDTPSPTALRLKLTLTGAATTSTFMSVASHLDIAGNLYNGVQSIRGGEGLISGSVIYSVEIYDASTSQLLTAYVTKQYPGAMNIAASLGFLAAPKTGIEKGADALVAQLQ